MSKIYLAIAESNYEGFSVMAASMKQEKAQKLCDACVEYLKKRPIAPGLDASDGKWDRFYAAEERWKAQAPKHYESGDIYCIMEVELL